MNSLEEGMGSPRNWLSKPIAEGPAGGQRGQMGVNEMQVLDREQIGHVSGGADTDGACLTANNGVMVCKFPDGSKVAVICDSTSTFNAQVALDILNWNKSRGGGGSAGVTYQTSTFNCTVVEISSAAELGKGNKTKPN